MFFRFQPMGLRISWGPLEMFSYLGFMSRWEYGSSCEFKFGLTGERKISAFGMRFGFQSRCRFFPTFWHSVWIFLQRLGADGPAPEVDWLKWDEKVPHAEYLKAALEQAKAKDSFLAYRRGGGDCIGIVVEGLLHKFRLWEVWGIPTDFGPSTVCQILGELKWEIHNRPTPPNGKSRPWIFHGRPADITDSLSYKTRSHDS